MCSHSFLNKEGVLNRGQKRVSWVLGVGCWRQKSKRDNLEKQIERERAKEKREVVKELFSGS